MRRKDENFRRLVRQRAIDGKEIREAYRTVEESLRAVGKLLRTTEAGHYMWASDHKSVVTGLRIVIEKLQHDVPRYGEET